MKVRVELNSIDSVSKGGSNYYVRYNGTSRDLPGRPIIAMAGPFTRDRASQMLEGLNSAVPKGVPFAEADLVCDVLGHYVDQPPQQGEKPGLAKIVATSATLLQGAELVLYRQFVRFLDMMERIREAGEDVPAFIQEELENFATSCGWNAISLANLAEMEAPHHPRPAESAAETPKPAQSKEDAAAEKLGIDDKGPQAVEPAVSQDPATHAAPASEDPVSAAPAGHNADDQGTPLVTMLTALMPEEARAQVLGQAVTDQAAPGEPATAAAPGAEEEVRASTALSDGSQAQDHSAAVQEEPAKDTAAPAAEPEVHTEPASVTAAPDASETPAAPEAPAPETQATAPATPAPVQTTAPTARFVGRPLGSMMAGIGGMGGMGGSKPAQAAATPSPAAAEVKPAAEPAVTPAPAPAAAVPQTKPAQSAFGGMMQRPGLGAFGGMR